MLDAFADVLATADHAVIADIWAGRDPDRRSPRAALAAAITRAARPPALATGSPEATADRLVDLVRPATWCWSWAAAARTSSRSGSSSAWRPALTRPSGRAGARPARLESGHGRLTHGDAQDLVDRLKRAWEKRDVDAALDCFAEDAELRPDPFAPPIGDQTAIRAWCNGRGLASSHAEADAERIWLAGDTVLVAFHGAWTERASAERTASVAC